MIKLRYLDVKQPIGSFYLCSIEASVLAKIVEIKPRGEHPDAVQRDQTKSRVKEISEYCGDSDATFPTPIIVAINLNANVGIDESNIYFDENDVIGDVIDGQHRLAGLIKSDYINDFQLPVVFMFDLEPSQKAYIFSIINSKQTRVNMSLIYDLFALSDSRSPYKTCHEIARAMNKDSSSPFYKRLKMLGKKEGDQFNASISQGTFIKYLLELISTNPDQDTRNLKVNKPLIANEKLPFRQYFLEEKDGVILKILTNLFDAVETVFENEWNVPEKYILSKSIGVGAILKSLPTMLELGRSRNDLSKTFFTMLLNDVKNHFESKKIEFTSTYYGSNEQARTKLVKDILSAIKRSS